MRIFRIHPREYAIFMLGLPVDLGNLSRRFGYFAVVYDECLNDKSARIIEGGDHCCFCRMM